MPYCARVLGLYPPVSTIREVFKVSSVYFVLLHVDELHGQLRCMWNMEAPPLGLVAEHIIHSVPLFSGCFESADSSTCICLLPVGSLEQDNEMMRVLVYANKRHINASSTESDLLE